MMPTIQVVLLILAIICFFCGFVKRPSAPVELGWLGAMFAALAVFFK